MPAPMGHPPYNTKGEGGRPKIWTDEAIEREADALEVWLEDKKNIFLEDFILERRIEEHHPSRWASSNERFRQVYNRFKIKQKSNLYKGGLFKKFDYRMCAGMLNLIHGVNLNTANNPAVEVKSSMNWLLDEVNGLSADLVNE